MSSPAIQIQPLFLDRAQAAAALSVSVRKFEAMVAAGEAPAARRISGQRVGWLWSELQQFAVSRPAAVPGVTEVQVAR